MLCVCRALLALTLAALSFAVGPALACTVDAAAGPDAHAHHVAPPPADPHAHHHEAPAAPTPADHAPDHTGTCALAIGCLVAVMPELPTVDAALVALPRSTIAAPQDAWAGPVAAPEPPPPRG
jgi:hypothetical protein